MQKITPFLWFDDQAEEAVNFYTNVFPNSKITRVTRYEGSGAKSAGKPEGVVMTISFQITARSSWPWTAGRTSPFPRPFRSW